MNKPESPEFLTRAEGLFEKAKDVSGRALRGAKEAGERMWKNATDAPDEDKRRKKVLWLTGGGIVAVIAVLFVLSRLGGERADQRRDGDQPRQAHPRARAVRADGERQGSARPVL
jgi:hypothetical protein